MSFIARAAAGPQRGHDDLPADDVRVPRLHAPLHHVRLLLERFQRRESPARGQEPSSGKGVTTLPRAATSSFPQPGPSPRVPSQNVNPLYPPHYWFVFRKTYRALLANNMKVSSKDL